MTTSGALLAGFFLPVVGSFHLADASDPTALYRYSASALIVSIICELLIAARERARKAERRLLESQRIYYGIGESIPFGIWICDENGRNQYTSESLLTLTGKTQRDFPEFGWTRVLHPDDELRILSEWQQCVNGTGTWDAEMRFLGIDGKYHPVLARGVPIRDEKGTIVSWAGINLHIIRLKDTEAELHLQAQELARSNRDLEQFAFVASHDIESPVRLATFPGDGSTRSAERE